MRALRVAFYLFIYALVFAVIVFGLVFSSTKPAEAQTWQSGSVVIFPSRNVSGYLYYRPYYYYPRYYYPRYYYPRYYNPYYYNYYYFPTPNTWPRFYVGPRGLRIY